MANAAITTETVQAVVGRAIPQAALDAALGLVQDYCGWRVLLDDYDVDLDADGSRLLVLPAMRITAVQSVSTLGMTPDDETVVDESRYRWSRAGMIESAGAPWPAGFRTVRVRFSAGYEDLPAPFIATVAALAERFALQAGVTQRLEQQTVGGVTTDTNTSYGGMAGFMLNPADMAVLNPYRLRIQP